MIQNKILLDEKL